MFGERWKPVSEDDKTMVKSIFNKLMSGVFGEHWDPPVPEDDKTNNFIGALANQHNFSFFKKQFMSMINELKKVYEGDGRETNNLIKTIKKIALERECCGAYAELCALHVLNNMNYRPIRTDNSLPATESFAALLGHSKETNLDGYIPAFDIYFDTKSFRDTITPILRNVTEIAIKKMIKNEILRDKPHVSILYQFPRTDSEKRYEDNVKELIDEFISEFSQKCIPVNQSVGKIARIQSNLIPDLTYVLNWGGISSTESCYSPYERAKNLVEPILVRYADKFLINHPFMLVMVNHPWFNQVDTDSFDFNAILYRALSRRVFMQYRYSARKMSDINPEFKGKETIDEVSKHISAILYIDVFSVVDKGQPYKCYLYANPRAVKPISANVMRCCSHQQPKWLAEMDDFKYNNY